MMGVETGVEATDHFAEEGRKTTLNPNFPANISDDHGLKRGGIFKCHRNQNHNTHLAWLRYVPYTALALVIMVVVGAGGWAFPDGANPTCSGSKNSAVCELEMVLLGAIDSLLMLTGFILGGFLISSRALWLEKRTAYAALCGATRNLLINVNTLAPPDARQLLARWTVLGYELSVLKARSLIDTEEGEQYLLLSRLLAGNEWETMVHGDRHTTVWYWIQSKAKQLKDRGQISEFELQTVCNAVTLSRDRANDLMSRLNRDQPPPYVFVCALLVNTNLFLKAAHAGIVWATWMNDAGGLRLFTEPRVYAAIIFFYLVTTIFAMLFDICAFMYNPFGPRDIDIRHDIIGKGIRQLSISLSREGGRTPETIDRDVVISDADKFLGVGGISAAERNLTERVSGTNEETALFHVPLLRRTVSYRKRPARQLNMATV